MSTTEIVYTADSGQTYTFAEILAEAKGNKKYAQSLIDRAEWEHISTIVERDLQEGEIIEQGDTYVLTGGEDSTTDSNKLIAEFIYPDWHEKDIKSLLKNQAQYATSWDWLMPVVKKIENLLFVTSIQYSQKYHRAEIHEHPQVLNTIGKFTAILGKSETSKLEATYKAVTEFIKWYNEQK